MNTTNFDRSWGPTSRIAFLAIGLAAYLGFHAAFSSMISFVNGGPLLWSSAESSVLPIGLRIAVDLGWIALFGLQHAVMARPWFKQRWTRIVPEPIERSIFVAATVAVLFGTLFYWQAIPGHAYQLESSPIRFGLFALQGVGWLTVVVSTFLIDHFELFGLRQVACAFLGRDLPAQQFRTPWLYKMSRHPMMVGMLVGLWATPDMSFDRLLFAAGFTTYVLLGVRLEERDLVRALGADYRRYQQQVPRFLPALPFRARCTAAVQAAGCTLAFGFLALGFAGEVRAQATSTDLSPDVSIVVGGAYFDDQDVVVDLGSGATQLADLGGLASSLSLDAYDLLDGGDELFSLDEPAALSGGLSVQPADVVRWNGAVYRLEFDASAHGLAPQIDVDAVSERDGVLYLSFDVTGTVSAIAFDDEDLVAFQAGVFSLVLDADTVGVPRALDLDGVHVFNQDLLGVSFDTSGSIGGVVFDDEDVLLFDRVSGGWSMHRDASGVDPAWRAADASAIHFVPEPGFVSGLGAGLGLIAIAARSRRRVRSAARGRGKGRVSRPSALAVSAVLTSLASLPAAAVDGVIEINQASALSGVALGDAPGFPVTLSLRGSYRLTGELNIPPNTTAIEMQNDQIHLDLNGFSIVGGGGTTGYGVYTASSLTRGQSVENGVIRGMPGGGIRLGTEARVEGVTVIASGGLGIEVAANSRVLDCTAIESGSSGIYSLGPGTRIHGSNGSKNGEHGIRPHGGEIRDSQAHENTLDGIHSFGATPVINVSATENGDDGIFAAFGPVIGSTSTFNEGYGLNMNDTGAYRDNVFYGNSDGWSTTQINRGVSFGPNLCYASVLCP